MNIKRFAVLMFKHATLGLPMKPTGDVLRWVDGELRIPMYEYRDTLGRRWLAKSRWSIFRIRKRN